MNRLIPDLVVDRLLHVTPEDLHALSPETRVVCMDIDGTVTDYHAASVPVEAQERIRSFTAAGLLTVIVSNCSGARVEEVHRLFDGLVTEVMTPADCVDPTDPGDSGRRHRKPAPDMLLEAASRLTVTDPAIGAERAVRPAEMLMIGDQMFKDVLVARRAGTKAVLLPRLGSHDHLGVRLLQRPVETVLRVLWRLPVRAEDWPGRLAAVGGRPSGAAAGPGAAHGGRR
ncbi:MAG: HAD-IIIA family hydrolase, partial [Actinomycetales bacterium]|nr:HAD-IIIA family hydrolase [Actinomycetales bacterium]